MTRFLTIALPKGKLGEDAIDLLAGAGLPTAALNGDDRRLIFSYPEKGIRYLICRPTDVPVYVEYGAADVGMVGKDTLVEANLDLFELLDLRFGGCKFVVAVPRSLWAGNGNFDLRELNGRRVATKFPRVAEGFFQARGMQVEVIKLHGNIELAPLTGLAEMIVDIVSTGRTLAENDLVAVSDIFYSTARLVANRVSYRLKFQHIQELVGNLRRIVEDGG